MASWMHRASRAWRIVAVASVVSFTTGCELLVDFDRSLIDGGSEDSGTDATGPMTDAGDATAPDSSPTDAAPVDSGPDATNVDASQDAGEDAQDAAPDAPPDAQADAATDGGDAGEDAAADAGADAAADAGEDAASDAAADAAVDAATDAGEDAGTDAGDDAGQDAGTLANGTACNGNTQCTSGVCGIAGTGKCCTAVCSPVGAPCGATACDGAGACVFPSTSTACATSCSGNTLTTLSCTGAGACASTGGATSSCSNDLACASMTACAAACGTNNAAGDANCVAGYYCDGVGAGGCQLPLAAGGTCNRMSQCTSSVCTGGSCQSPSCTDGVKNGTETDTDCGGTCSPCANTKNCLVTGDCQSESCISDVCVEATVLVVGAGAASSFGSELHPSTLGNGTWSTPTSLGAPSVSDLGLAFISSGATPEAVAALRYTLTGDPLDQALVYTTWTEASGFAQFAAVASGVTTREVPAIAGTGGSAFVTFQGVSDFDIYFAEFDGTTWSPTNEAVGTGGVPTPAGIAAIGSTASIAYFSVANDPTAQDRATTWQTATTLGTDASYVATPSMVAMNGGTAELLTVYIRQSDGALVYNARTAGTWSTSSTIPGAAAPASTSYGPVERVGLAALPSGGAIVTWRDATTSEIFYSLYAAGAWSVAPIAFASPNAVVSAAPAITHGVAGATAEMAFVAGDGNAYHSRLVSGTWSSPLQAISGGGVDHVAIAAAP
jgi:hypothetical protein